MPDNSQKTEKPTPKRKREAREKGQVAKSKEFGTVSILLASLIVFYFYGLRFLHHLSDLMQWLLQLPTGCGEFKQSHLMSLLFQIEMRLVPILAPVIIPMVIFALLANFGQVGFLLTGEPLKPDLNKMNPINGFQNLFSLRSLIELVKSFFKLGVIGYIAYLTIKQELPYLPLLSTMSTGGIFFFICRISFKILVRSTIALLIMSIMDYAYQRYEWNKKLMMTKDEVKEEMKQSEGDPLIKGQIRRAQQRIARQRMMDRVPQADVVITNPQHLAVAISYKAESMTAPRVIAKGAGLIAQRIKEIAREHGIPLVEDKPLARLIYKTIEVGESIPPHLYQAVAEILAYVYQLRPQKYTK